MMKRLMLAATAFALIAGSAVAQDRPDPPSPDLDHDGRVTLAEFKKMEAQREARMFARLDTNKDGKITQAEFDAAPRRESQAGQQAPPAGGRGRFFQMMDKNGDGAISKAEMEAMGQRRFDMADTNHDGWLSKGELIMMRQRRGPPAVGAAEQ